jgi:SAM domain (Sterile alpha motif)
MDVAEWLRGLGLDQYITAFRANDIDGEVLRRLTGEDLRELGIASIGHRRRLLDAIAALGTAEAMADHKNACLRLHNERASSPVGSSTLTSDVTADLLLAQQAEIFDACFDCRFRKVTR